MHVNSSRKKGVGRGKKSSKKSSATDSVGKTLIFLDDNDGRALSSELDDLERELNDEF